MRRLKNRRIPHRKDAELDVTPFMNLMMVLVAAMLLSVVFSKITVIDLDFPAGNGAGAFDPEQVHLEVIVRDDGLVVADGRVARSKRSRPSAAFRIWPGCRS